MTKFLSASLFFLSATVTAAQAEVPCKVPPTLNSECQCEISSLRPTQSAVGYFEVERRVKKFKEMKPKKMEKYLRKRPVPFVLGPGNTFYPTDHHHLARALIQSGRSTALCKMELDLSKLSATAFWEEMGKRKLVYLFDEMGKPILAEQLPSSIKEMKDDVYRSIAGQVRERGGYEKSNAPFSEFEWADYFRSRIKKPSGEKEYEAAISEALALAQKRNKEAK